MNDLQTQVDKRNALLEIIYVDIAQKDKEIAESCQNIVEFEELKHNF
jgi:hypothetical protein